jgi:hypothetical protein
MTQVMSRCTLEELEEGEDFLARCQGVDSVLHLSIALGQYLHFRTSKTSTFVPMSFVRRQSRRRIPVCNHYAFWCVRVAPAAPLLQLPLECALIMPPACRAPCHIRTQTGSIREGTAATRVWTLCLCVCVCV